MKKPTLSMCFSERRTNSIILSLYLLFISICQIIVSSRFQTYYFFFGSSLWIIISFFLAPLMIRLFSTLELRDGQLGHNMSRWKSSLVFYGIPFSVLLIYYAAYYPGAFPTDSFNQYRQVITGHYSDWHPVLHTLFSIWLPLKITGGWIGAISLFQILIFTVALGYCFQTIRKYAGKKYAAGSMIYILCNPLICTAVIPWKDTSFAIGALLLVVFSIEIIMTKGMWLNSFPHITGFVIVMVFTTVFRHNAVLFTVPLLFAVLFQIRKKSFLIVLLSSIALLALIKGPLYSAVHVEKPDNRQVETLGLPMTVIGAAVTYNPDALDDDILEFAYKIARKDVWENYYTLGEFNDFKFSNESNEDVIEEYGSKRVLEMMFRCIKASPTISLSALVKLTESVYTVTDPHPVLIYPYIDANDYGIERASDRSTPAHLVYSIRSFVQDFFPHIFLFYGVADLLVISTVLSRCNRKNWKIALFALPLLVYNFGTSLLLTGYSDSPRYFYYTVLILPALLVIFYRKIGQFDQS